MYQTRPWPKIRDILWTKRFPFQLEQNAPWVLGGDWDLKAQPGARTPDAGPPRLLPIAVGRDGDLIADDSSSFTAMDGRVPVAVVGRHAIWDKFRRDILGSAEPEDGEVYAPLTHIDLSDIPFWTGPERVSLIRKNILRQNATVLDIGSHWGYMCEELERDGHRCVAVEVNPASYSIMLRLRRAQQFTYRTALADATDFVKRENSFDVVLALAVFHHFIKTERGHSRLIELLAAIKARQIFFWTHNPDEAQMGGAYMNYAGDEFAAFILEHSKLSKFELLGFVDGRPLYHLM